MKRLFTLVFIIYCTNASAQKDSAIKYWEVVKIDSVSKDGLYQRARQWVNNSFNSGKAVLEIQDKENGQLSGNGNFDTHYKYTNVVVQSDQVENIKFKFNIYVKDGKYKYEFSGFNASSNANMIKFSEFTSSTECPDNFPMVRQKKMNAFWAEIKDNVDKQMQITINGLKKAMNTLAPTETNNF